MNILEQITAFKRQEVAERKALYPVKLLEQTIYFETQPVSFRKYLLRQDLHGIIAEFKRKSPSLGIINAHASVERTTIGYMQAGASALSVLTDAQFFGGKNDDLKIARKFNFCPILRKDFIIDEYQIIEAKSIGADVILLIAGILQADEVNKLAAFAKSLGLEILLEVHDREELERTLTDQVDAIGVNNRNLKDFSVSINTSKELAALIPDKFVKVSESGISKAETILDLRTYGYRGFLMGEAFMKTSRPEKALASFIETLKTDKPIFA
ncbi:indole-3-glycerol phosphate synthase TrpC [Adhaeribacter radiodurans]|uniref:Indole-3-glycerol phosphate synthase n=1 Tax=Adhaeribacter radiodurans TaxID=2745197 RepID=A0A7L7LFF8_9BACT|nr:indole-3-glycerol phosphate synthase TrpC [Adhaeribacter radiodurans]QMU31570.1 indole-3-glycerol phosphate synthase TrpC [Adhaeribacter radiodurans]